MPDIGGIPYVESSDLVSGWPTVSQSVAQEVSDQLASKLPYSFGTATPSTTDSGFLWYDSNSTPAAPKFWDGAAFQALTSGKLVQIVRDTDSTQRSTTSTSFVDVTGMSVTITPTKSDSAILLIASVTVNPGSTTFNARIQITDASNIAISGASEVATDQTAGIVQQTAFAYATPATTSPTTYKLRFRANGGGTAEIRNDINIGQLYAIEVAA